ncbi:MAG: PhoH family protein [Parachlamydiales bacterium]|jgi:PhoH-like ATPase
MVRKSFVIDTNVLLYDPSAIGKFKDNDVIIPLIVLEELDAYKKNSDERGRNARSVLRYIDSLKLSHKGDYRDGIELPEGTKVLILLETGRENDFPLLLDRLSNKMLSICHQLKKKKERVIFVSKDFVSRVKAEAMGLEVEDYENLKSSYDQLHRGLRKIRLPKSEIDAFYANGFLQPEGNDFLPNEYCLLASEEKSSGVCKYNIRTKRLEPLMRIDKGIWGVLPLNVEQKCVIDLLLRDDIPLVALMGPAGTGKTLWALACGLKKVFDENMYTKILISRPIVPLGKDIGYLPGTKEEKLYHWMQPIYDNLEYICGASSGKEQGTSALDFIMQSKKIEMEAVTYIRGRTLPRVYMIIDEAQNLTPHEAKTIISRAGKGAKVILTGDPTQIDNPYLDKDSNGLTYTLSKFYNHKLFGHVFLDKTERSDLAAIAADLM